MHVFRLGVLGAAVLMASALPGCATLGIDKAIKAGEPLLAWEKDLVAYYTATIPPSPDQNHPPKLRFIQDYEDKFPQLNGVPFTEIDEKKAAFPELTYDQYAAYRRDRVVSELHGQKLMLRAEDESLRLAMLEAQLKVKKAEIALLDSGGRQDTPEYQKLEAALADIIEDMKCAHAAIKEAKLAALDYEIERVSRLTGGNESKKLEDNHLKAAGILELAKHERNRILGDLIVIARRVHDMKDNYLHYTRATANMLFDFTQIIATGVGSVAGSEGTARALAALATGSAAAQESVDSRYFYQHATAAMLSTMKGQRHKAEQLLVQNMNKDVLEYPLRVALADYAAFLVAGGLTEALAELGADAKVKELKELQKLNELKAMSAARLEELKAIEEARSAEAAAKKARQKAYVDLVDQAAFGRLDSILNPPSDPEGEGEGSE